MCAKCGKKMEEGPKFPGLWLCPDYKIRLNDRPPFQFACTGMEMTQRGYRDIERELNKLWAQQN